MSHVENIINLVEDFQPRVWRQHENKFRDDLCEYIRNEGGYGAETEGKKGNRRFKGAIDVLVNTPGRWEVPIEIKRNFPNRRADADILERQIRERSGIWRHLVVCSFGFSNEAEWNRMIDKYQGSFNGCKIFFIPKPKPQNRQRGRQQGRSGQQEQRNNSGIDWRDPFSSF
jgi:hypothetical protein